MADSNFASVSLLLHGDGSNGGTTFTDSSSYAHPVAGTGGAPVTSTASPKFGTAAISLNGASRINFADANEFDLPGDFTIEGFIKTSAVAAQCIVSKGMGGVGPYSWSLETTAAGKALILLSSVTNPATDGVDYITLTGATTVNDGAYHHVAATRNGSTFSLWVDGALDGTISFAPAGFNNNVPVVVGARYAQTANSYSAFFTGQIDELRITKGVARYTAPFTAPTAAFGDGTGIVTGIPPATAFGTPTATWAQAEQATGIDSSAAFGTPVAIYPQIGQATGLDASAAFGTPVASVVSNVVEQATGIAPATTFGLPVSVNRATGFTSTAFGLPSVPVNFVCKARSIVSGGVGVPAIMRYRDTGPRNWRGAAQTIHATKFGLPRT